MNPISALHNIIPTLERLEEVAESERAEEVRGLDRLRMDDGLKWLEKLIEDQRAEFDALHFIGVSGSEEFHSKVLAWLLDPSQTHGIGDRFLKPFLVAAGVGPEKLAANWSETEVKPEWANLVDGQWGYLDILVVNGSQRTLCAIENKVFSSEHSEQLTRYRQALERDYPDFERHYVFLSPWGTQPYREQERACWTCLSYNAVFDNIQKIAESGSDTPTEDVRGFLRQYATTLRRNIVPDSSVPQMARKIYLEHREAMEQIIANKPNYTAEVRQWLKGAIARQSEWILDVEDANFVRFRSADWDSYEITRTGKGWGVNSNSVILFQFRCQGGLPLLELWHPPEDEDKNPLKQKLFESVRQYPELFKSTSGAWTASWLNLHTEAEHVLDADDLGVGWDNGTTRAKLEDWVERFAVERFPAMNEVIVNCLREYEAEREKEGQGG